MNKSTLNRDYRWNLNGENKRRDAGHLLDGVLY